MEEVDPNRIAPAPKFSVEFNKQIILLDGVCNMCDGVVNFMFARDPNNLFYYAPLQSELGHKLLYKHNIPYDLNTVVFVDEVEGKAYTHSTAILKVMGGLSFPWNYASCFLLVPQIIRDFVYGLVAKHRYRVFGKSKSACAYKPGLRKRFLDFSEEQEEVKVSTTKYEVKYV